MKFCKFDFKIDILFKKWRRLSLRFVRFKREKLFKQFRELTALTRQYWSRASAHGANFRANGGRSVACTACKKGLWVDRELLYIVHILQTVNLSKCYKCMCKSNLPKAFLIFWAIFFLKFNVWNFFLLDKGHDGYRKYILCCVKQLWKNKKKNYKSIVYFLIEVGKFVELD